VDEFIGRPQIMSPFLTSGDHNLNNNCPIVLSSETSLSLLSRDSYPPPSCPCCQGTLIHLPHPSPTHSSIYHPSVLSMRLTYPCLSISIPLFISLFFYLIHQLNRTPHQLFLHIHAIPKYGYTIIYSTRRQSFLPSFSPVVID
jgi:hypothetical protein